MFGVRRGYICQTVTEGFIEINGRFVKSDDQAGSGSVSERGFPDKARYGLNDSSYCVKWQRPQLMSSQDFNVPSERHDARSIAVPAGQKRQLDVYGPGG
jgi:hypothetical protein